MKYLPIACAEANFSVVPISNGDRFCQMGTDFLTTEKSGLWVSIAVGFTVGFIVAVGFIVVAVGLKTSSNTRQNRSPILPFFVLRVPLTPVCGQ